MQRDIFISHTTVDKAVAAKLCESLESTGLTCWIAPRDISPGSNWTMSIMRAISDCKIMILVFSAKCNESTHVQREVLHAIENQRPVFPIRIEDARPLDGLAYCLVGVQWFDAIKGPLKGHVAALAAQMRGLLQRSNDAAASTSQQPNADAITPPERSTPPDILFECSQCGQRMVIDAGSAGGSGYCPSCNFGFTVPQLHTSPPGPDSKPATATSPNAPETYCIPPAALTKIEGCFTEIVGPIAPRMVRKAISKTSSISALRVELLASILSESEQKAFLHCCGNIFTPGIAETISRQAPSSTPVSSDSASCALVIEPSVVAELKSTFATFVGPLAKVLVERALARTSNVTELLNALAGELDSQSERERFLSKVPPPLLRARQP